MNDLLRPEYDRPGNAPKVLSAERRLVTVLFADIVQSTQFVLAADPEEANDRLIPVLNIMADLVFRYGGTLAQVLGDGVLALFGVPRAMEEHTLRACLAASEMQRVIKELEGDLAIRVGISSGEIIVESCSNGEYRPVGAAVHLAAKAQAFAPAGQILLTEKAYCHVDNQVTARSHQALNLSAYTPSVPTFVLEDVLSRGRSSPQAKPPAPAPFIGRTKELRLLNAARREVANGRGTVIRIVGDAGIGKSRLVDHFLRQQPAKANRIQRCELQPQGMQNAFEAAACMLFPALGINADTDSSEFPDAASLTRAIEKTGAVRPVDIRTTLDVLGIGEHTPANAEPRSKLRVAMRSIVSVAVSVSLEIPIIYVLEDLHWSDTATNILVEELTKRAEESRMLVILTTREVHGEEASHNDMTLGPLGRNESEQIIQRVIGSRWHINSDLLDLVMRKSQGNPFFMEECAKIWLEKQSRESNVVRPPASQDPFNVPENVHAVLAERIDALPAPARNVLLLMSVIGDTIDFRVLKKVAADNLAVTLAVLPELAAKGFVSRTRILPQVEFRFKHALVRDVAYKTLPKSTRHRIHSLVYEALLSTSGAQPAALAHHALQSGRWRDAYANSNRAARNATSLSRNREARDHFYGAIGSLEHLPKSRRNKQRTIDLHIDTASTLSTMGRHNEARQNLTTALWTARGVNDRRRGIIALSDAALSQWADGRLRKASAASALAYRLATANNMTQTAIQSSIRSGMILADRGEYVLAKQTLHEASRLIPARDKHEKFGLLGVASSGALASLAAVHGELGEFQDAIHMGDAALQIAEQSGHPFSQLYANIYAADVLLRQGRFESAVPLLERATTICEQTASEVLFPLAASLLGYAYTHLGRPASGILQMCDALESSAAQGLQARRALGSYWLADAYLRIGQDQRAAKLASSAVTIAKHAGEFGFKAWAHYTLGSVYLKQQRNEQAAEQFRLAESLAYARAMKPLTAHCQLGQVRAGMRHTAEAAARVGDIIQVYRSMGMNYWADRARDEFAITEPKAERSMAGIV